MQRIPTALSVYFVLHVCLYVFVFCLRGIKSILMIATCRIPSTVFAFLVTKELLHTPTKLHLRLYTYLSKMYLSA